ncbi:unnamed protein product, partial [Mesorhabditis belari]|uniref:DUF7027 domain-containing protein n=1 Tax=Mesorhabditis belari TaxID=2138241 RepID=A0AAF3EHU9_9BILA
MTCFGLLHVRIATCFIGLFSLLGVCFSLIYCVISSQNVQPGSARPNYKLAAIPMIITIITILFLFIGILQQKAKHLYPFVVLQVIMSFVVSIMLVMMMICALCETRYVLNAFIGKVDNPEEYKLSVTILISVLGFQFLLQLWTTRAVCCCYRYFIDLERFEFRKAQFIL